jgi:hypothetical protein
MRREPLDLASAGAMRLSALDHARALSATSRFGELGTHAASGAAELTADS